MTVIAWDGTTLAADRLSDNSGMAQPCTKIFRVRGHLVGASGRAASVTELIKWFEDGAVPDQLPAFQRTDDWAAMLVITPDSQALLYERGALPLLGFANVPIAIGSGSEVALAAMSLGNTAEEAVLLTNSLRTDCGMGVDTLTIEWTPEIQRNEHAEILDFLKGKNGVNQQRLAELRWMACPIAERIRSAPNGAAVKWACVEALVAEAIDCLGPTFGEFRWASTKHPGFELLVRPPKEK